MVEDIKQYQTESKAALIMP